MYKEKYLKYKTKYIDLQNQLGGRRPIIMSQTQAPPGQATQETSGQAPLSQETSAQAPQETSGQAPLSQETSAQAEAERLRREYLEKNYPDVPLEKATKQAKSKQEEQLRAIRRLDLRIQDDPYPYSTSAEELKKKQNEVIKDYSKVPKFHTYDEITEINSSENQKYRDDQLQKKQEQDKASKIKEEQLKQTIALEEEKIRIHREKENAEWAKIKAAQEEQAKLEQTQAEITANVTKWKKAETEAIEQVMKLDLSKEDKDKAIENIRDVVKKSIAGNKKKPDFKEALENGQLLVANYIKKGDDILQPTYIIINPTEEFYTINKFNRVIHPEIYTENSFIILKKSSNPNSNNDTFWQQGLSVPVGFFINYDSFNNFHFYVIEKTTDQEYLCTHIFTYNQFLYNKFKTVTNSLEEQYYVEFLTKLVECGYESIDYIHSKFRYENYAIENFISKLKYIEILVEYIKSSAKDT
jgi:hypothetical protein